MSSPKDKANLTHQSPGRLGSASDLSDISLASICEYSVCFGLGSGLHDGHLSHEEICEYTPMVQTTPSINNLSLSKLSTQSQCNKNKYCFPSSDATKTEWHSLFATPLCGSKVGSYGGMKAGCDAGMKVGSDSGMKTSSDGGMKGNDNGGASKINASNNGVASKTKTKASNGS
eukprot:15344400-Ditylum_brightwellii.AAC.1